MGELDKVEGIVVWVYEEMMGVWWEMGGVEEGCEGSYLGGGE